MAAVEEKKKVTHISPLGRAFAGKLINAKARNLIKIVSRGPKMVIEFWNRSGFLEAVSIVFLFVVLFQFNCK